MIYTAIEKGLTGTGGALQEEVGVPWIGVDGRNDSIETGALIRVKLSVYIVAREKLFDGLVAELRRE